MTSFDIGRRAEAAAASYLQQNGFKIIDQNWRTKWCEIDIVALKDQSIYFVEVKYRSNKFSGAGLEYVTPAKLVQMRRAAESWVQINNWSYSYSLGVIEVSGQIFAIMNVLLDI